MSTKRPGKTRPRLTGRQWLTAGLLAALLVCVLPWAIPKARHAYREWSEGRERARQGRAAALAQISRNHLGIDIGSEEPWRLTFQRLLSERHGLWFRPPPNPRYHQGPWVQDEWSDAYQEVMDAAVARRFAPGELEAVAEEARAIHEKYLAEHPGEDGAAVELGPVPSLGDPALADPEAGRRFLKLLETRAGLPVLNEPGYRRVTRYVSSGSRGHAIRIHGIPDLPRQMEIVDMAQEILNGGEPGMIYLEFVDEEFPLLTNGKPGFFKGEVRLNRILTKEGADVAESPDQFKR